MNDSPEYLEGEEFIFKYGRLRLLPLDQLRKDEFGDTIATEQRAYRRERVVRCRDCAYYFEGDCLLLHVAMPDMDGGFCSWGEPREGDS